ncbi:MAG TPA: 3'-5' exonuclease, partial [Bacteroidales bacterium]|nr:3'-5' exonuclease [Bacteroidales bacterium]
AAIASFLLQKGVDVVSSESLLLSSSPKVNFIVSLLRYVDNPADELAAAYILNFLQHNYPADYDLNALIAQYQSVKSAGKSKYPLNEIFAIFQKDIECVKMSGTPLFDLVESLVRTFGFHHQSDPFMVYFLDAISEFVSTKTPCLPDFIAWWDEKGATRSIVVPEQLNAVKIMTIHKAKGLEFPVVIYPFADEMPGSKGASAWVMNSFDYCPEIPAFPIAISAKGLEGSSFSDYFEQEQSLARLDMMNICYVALTRPEEQLYVLTKKYKENGHSFGSLLKKYLMHRELWSEENDVYEFGSIAAVTTKEKHTSKGQTVVPENILSSDWAARMLIRHDSTVLWADDETATTRGWGNIIHKILSEIKQAEDAIGVTTGMLLEGIISQADAEKITKYIEQLMANPHFKSFFEPGLPVLTEAEILTPGNKVYRPDRILFEKDKNVVVDFKTGVQKDDHKTQIDNYAAILTEINNKPTEKFLIYLHEEPLIIKVD